MSIPPFISSDGSQALSLSEIASWDPDTISDIEPPIRASVPALQRGLVWRPQQIEILWDSILRGFPIGALVVCKKIAGQERKEDERVTHHLLDGQQRYNAIALGFTDAFPSDGAQADTLKKTSIVWLDLKAVKDANSTRSFLVRVTTLAHPWGYVKTDAAGPLSPESIRQAIKPLGLNPADPQYRRPVPRELQPYAASSPIPLAWLLLSPEQNQEAFWSQIARRASDASALRWTNGVLSFLHDGSPSAAEQRDLIYRGVMRARATKIIALNAPQEILEVSQQEKEATGSLAEITNVEHLFQRLNQQGTRLDGEELAYSLIKAYWPELADPIDRISSGRMPEARMVAIGVRAALAQSKEERLPAVLTVSAVRALARGEGERKQIVYQFIEERLAGDCDQVDRWLRYDAEKNRTGLLAVHITSIALNSPDVYLLLLCFAEHLRHAGADDELLHSWTKPMQGLGTLLHWFAAKNKDKGKVANRIFGMCRHDLSLSKVSEALRESVKVGELCPIHSPAEVDSFVRLPEREFENWHWWRLIHTGGDLKGSESRRDTWEGFLKFRDNQELLLYAQRAFLARRFPDYDPARRELWDSHNRPWDFDHILASYYLYYGRGGFKAVCDEWAPTIANLRAWPFEDNRSDSQQSAKAKIEGHMGRLADSFLTPDEVDAFSLAHAVLSDPASARRFVETCRTRLVRIYREWYQSLEIAQLIKPAEVASQFDLLSANGAPNSALSESLA